MKKAIKLLAVILFSAGALAMVVFFVLGPKVLEITGNTAQPSASPVKSATLVLVGDIMLDRGVEYKTEKEYGGDFTFPFLKIADITRKADLAFGNLESQISDQGRNVGSAYSFRANPQALAGLKFAGFDVLSLANNHALDYTTAALKDSLNRLLDKNIAPVGAGNEAQAFAPTIRNVNGNRIAFFAYTDIGPKSWLAKGQDIGIAHISADNLERVKADIGVAKQLSDIVIISLHSGEEYQREPNQSQIDFSHSFIDAGADLVINHHSHVIERNEVYKDKPIFYGLGNFIFDQSFSGETMEGQMLRVSIENGKISKIVPLKIKINKSFQPELAE